MRLRVSPVARALRDQRFDVCMKLSLSLEVAQRRVRRAGTERSGVSLRKCSRTRLPSGELKHLVNAVAMLRSPPRRHFRGFARRRTIANRRTW